MTYRHAFPYALKRLWHHRFLALNLTIGLLIAVALATTIPVYADGIHASVLHSSLSKNGPGQPFDFVFRYVGSWHEPVRKDQYQPVNQYLSQQAIDAIGLPGQGVTRYVATVNLQLFPFAETLSPANRLERVKLAFLSDVFAHVRLIEGRLPRSVKESSGKIEALVTLDLANALDLRVGQAYALFLPASGSVPAYRTDVEITGIWVASDLQEAFWAIYPADSYQKKLLVSEDAWWSATEQIPTPVDEAAWRLALDGSGITSERVSNLLTRIGPVQNRAAALLPHTDLERSPVAALREYRSKAQALTGSLFAFSVPVLGLTLFFLGLSAGQFVRSQHSEIAVLRSRGARRTWILVVYLCEWSVLGLAAWLLGLPAGLLLAGLVGRTQSFLDFSNLPAFTPHLGFQAAILGLSAIVIGIACCLIPVWQLGRDTVLSYKQERARIRRTPLWQRLYLDAACLLPALYGWYTLRSQGRISVLGRAVGNTDPYQNPLLFLLPARFFTGVRLAHNTAAASYPQRTGGTIRPPAGGNPALRLAAVRSFRRRIPGRAAPVHMHGRIGCFCRLGGLLTRPDGAGQHLLHGWRGPQPGGRWGIYPGSARQCAKRCRSGKRRVEFLARARSLAVDRYLSRGESWAV